MKTAVSFTLDAQNVLWLKGQAARAAGTVSGVVNTLVTDARHSGHRDPGAVRTVVGTIDLPDRDPDLANADVYIRTVFDRSIRRPAVVKERQARYRAKARRRRG